MNKITFPLKVQMHSPGVADLQDGLLFLLGKGVFALSAAERQAFEQQLRAERSQSNYGEATRRLVVLFQQKRQLQPTGEVDEPTARALNAELEQLGAFSTAAEGQQRLVGGQVRREDGQPLAGVLVRAFHVDDQVTLRLGEDSADAEGRYTIRYAGLPGVDAIHLRVVAFDAKGGLLRAADVIQDAKPLEIVDLIAPAVGVVTFQVEGTVASRVSAGVGGLRVRIVDKTVGDDMQLAEATTDENGAYRAVFTDAALTQRGKARPDLQARVFASDTFLAASEVRYNAAARETLNIRLDDPAVASLRSEYQTLTGALSTHFKGKLGDLQETDSRQDITYLANKTGWDARAVALAALAEQFSARTADTGSNTRIEPALFYALFRAGLPANEDMLYHTDAGTVEAVWKQAVGQGVIPASVENQLPVALKLFRKLASLRVLASPALIGASSLKEILPISLGDNPQRQQKFTELYTRYQGDMPQFWDAVRGAFGEAAEKRLKLDGQLAYLTLNNAPLIRRLHAAAGQNGLANALSLVEAGYYRPEKWQDAIGKDSIPPEIPGVDDAEKRSRYAELLAAQVRLSYPTAVVAQMVRRGETPLPQGLAGPVHTFLTDHQGKFEIGMQPVEQYVARNNLQVATEVTQQITRIQRVYQITPSDDAMNALLKNGLDSAYAIARYDRAEFARSIKDQVGGEANARLIHARAQQVHNAVLNIAVSYLTARNAPGIGAHSPAQIIPPTPAGAGSPSNAPGIGAHTPAQSIAPALTDAKPHASDVIAYPTLESLFGEMGYCECEHCRSILSPAAYLVDLLQFIDPPVVDAGENPQTVLFSRRPDIQHLPLTCENTNIPLPYIDIVNETLEYYVTHNLKLKDTGAEYQGHSIDADVTPEELLANPQFVEDAAYETLAAAHFPPPLPFHRSLENLRRYFDKFEAPLPKVMEALRKDDKLERPDPIEPANPDEYGWRDILMEELRLSRAEYKLLTDRTLTLQQLYGYPATKSEHDVLAELSNVRAFTRRMGITYEDIIEILKTRFMNPNATLIPKVERLGVSFSLLQTLKNSTKTGPEWLDLLPSPRPDASHYGGDIEAWVKDEANYDRIMSLMTLANPEEPEDVCGFDKVTLRYADPTKIGETVRAFEFVRMIRFIRLWRKLGWSIEQTDKAITALYPANQDPAIPEAERLGAAFLTLLPRLGVIKRVMDALNLKPQQDLRPLLACFAPIDTHGATSLYRQMFLNPVLLKQDGVFADDGYGNFLDGTEELIDHTEALRAAFLLSDAEFTLIAERLPRDPTIIDRDTISNELLLTLKNLTAIFRRGWLARKLKLSVREFLLLTQFTRIDPFAAPDPADPPILRFIELVSRLHDLSLKPVQALYLIWNQDISGVSALDDSAILGFTRTLRSDLVAIESEFAMADDPEGQIARARMALIYGNEATEIFFGLLGNTLVTDVPYGHGQATLEQPILDCAPGRIAYDDFRKRLSFAGVLTAETCDALKDVNVSGMPVSPDFKATVDELYVENQKVIGPFFARYPELQPLYDSYIASDDPAEKKRSDLLANFLPELRRRRKQQHALQTIGAATKTDAALASSILEDASVLHVAGDTARPALNDLTVLETPGLSVQFFFRDTVTGSVDLTSVAQPTLAYSPTGANTLPENGGNPISGIWSGYLEAPESGAYNIRIEADAGATVSLTLNGMVRADLLPSGNVWSNIRPIELRAGTLYAISLKVEHLMDSLSVSWETRGRGWEVIPARYLYSATMVDHLRNVYVRFLKAASLAMALKLTAAETTYLASRTDYQIGGQGWLNSMPVIGNPDDDTSTALLKALTALLDFARIKANLSPSDERLLTVLQDPTEATQNPDSLLFTLTRWELASLNVLLARFGKGLADLGHLETFGRIYNAYGWVKKLGISASALIKAATNEPVADSVSDFQAALRAHYDERDWLSVLKPINDEMRGLQRDALVAYILHQMQLDPEKRHIDTPDKLFEYFLMDVQMEPCMQTSRIRHVLSSVQLFIERCLMNLELPRVAPSSINAKQWKWMSRYRVWEANRKVFLYPENWLEPELRDDQSPFFKETMSELLQSDITEDSGATALLNYLSKLEEVAKLEPCGIHYGENEPTLADDIAHVVARTAGANRKYFYRRREPSGWTPWEQIKLDIEDNPVIPVVWKGRLFLFWLKILKQAPLDAASLESSSSPAGSSSEEEKGLADIRWSEVKQKAQHDAKTNTMVIVQAVLCWSEYYNGKWQPTKTSDVNKPAELGNFPLAGAHIFDRSKLRLQVSEDELTQTAALRIFILYSSVSSFLLYNTHSLPVTETDRTRNIAAYLRSLTDNPARFTDTSNDILTILYDKKWAFGLPKDIRLAVLGNSISARTVEPRHMLLDPWDAPFFYEDSRHVFYVTTTKRIATIPNWSRYIRTPSLRKPNLTIPPIVFKPARIISDKYRGIIEGLGFGVVDPSSVGRFVSEDAYIARGIGTPGTVRFGDTEIGPAGGSNGIVPR